MASDYHLSLHQGMVLLVFMFVALIREWVPAVPPLLSHVSLTFKLSIKTELIRLLVGLRFPSLLY